MAANTHSIPAAPTIGNDLSNPIYQAYRALQIGFIVAPILAGLDKFVGLLTDWTQYLWPPFADLLGLTPATFMGVVGVVEIAAGIIVAVKPRFGGYLVAAWLAGIILNLVLVGGFWDIALRDLGLAIGAFALARLASTRGPR
jgi:hypothetical protein